MTWIVFQNQSILRRYRIPRAPYWIKVTVQHIARIYRRTIGNKAVNIYQSKGNQIWLYVPIKSRSRALTASAILESTTAAKEEKPKVEELWIKAKGRSSSKAAAAGIMICIEELMVNIILISIRWMPQNQFLNKTNRQLSTNAENIWMKRPKIRINRNSKNITIMLISHLFLVRIQNY